MNTQLKQASQLFRFFVTELQDNIDHSDYTVEDAKDCINDIKDNYLRFHDLTQAESGGYQDFDNVRVLSMLKTALKATDSYFNDLKYYEFFDLLDEFLDGYKGDKGDDFYIDSLPCGEVRIINEDKIDEIWTNGLIETVKECYQLPNVPDFVVIDWEATANNCKVDGRGSHFAGYDGEEHYSNGYYIFRTN